VGAEAGTRHLHPYEVISMVNHAHLVGFRVAYADLRCVSGHETPILAGRVRCFC
jgi:hypothetical protein